MDLYKIEIDLSQGPEKSAEKLYEELRGLPLEVLQKLEMIVEEVPLTKSFKKDYSMNDAGD
jgi:hypothetical protein